jgi:phage portal protein BeeE
MSRLETIAVRPNGGVSMLSRFANAWRSLRSYTIGPLTAKSPELAKYWGRGSTSTGITVNEQTAFGVSAFYCAVVMIAEDIASLPLFLFDGKQRSSQPLNRLLHDQPNPEMTSFCMRSTWLMNALTFGNGYAEIERDGAGRPAALWPLQSTTVHPYRENYGPLLYRVTNHSGRRRRFRQGTSST